MDHLCYLCPVFVMLSRLFTAALWSPEGKALTSWLLFVMYIVILLCPGHPHRFYYGLNLMDDPSNANFRCPIRMHYIRMIKYY